jgi:hypothetical protein
MFRPIMLATFVRLNRTFIAFMLLIALLVVFFAGPVYAQQQSPSPITLEPNIFMLSSKHFNSAANNNSTLISAGKHSVYYVQIANTTGTDYWIKFYDKATAPTCQTDAVVGVVKLTANKTTKQFLGRAVTAGLGYCIVANGVDTDNTSAATGLYGDVYYK